MEYLSKIFIGLPVAPNFGMGFLYLKKTKWRTAHPEGVACPTPTSMGPISVRRGRVISGRLANRFGSRFGSNTKLLPGVIGPTASAPGDYLSTVFDDVILACEGAAVYNKQTAPPPPPHPSLFLDQTEARKAEKKILETGPLLISGQQLRVNSYINQDAKRW